MQSVLATFPFLAPPAEGPVDMGPGAKGVETFSLLLGEGGATVADTAEPQVVSIEPAMVAAGLVPPQFWSVAVSPPDPAPAPEIKPAPAATGVPNVALSPGASHESPTPAVRSLPEDVGSTLAADAAFPTIGSTGTTTRHPANDTVADWGAGKALGPIIETAAPKLPGSELAAVAGGGIGETEGRHKDAWAPVPFASTFPDPHRAGIHPQPDAQPRTVGPMVAPDQVTKASAGDHRPTPGTGSPVPDSASSHAPAAGAKGPESHQPEPIMPGIDASEPQPTAGPDGPDSGHVVVRSEPVSHSQADETIPVGTPDLTGGAAAEHDSATVPDAPMAAVTDPDAPIPQPTPVAGIWERIVIGLAEAATPTPMMGPEDASSGQFAGSGGFAVPFDQVREPATEAARTGATVLAPDPTTVPAPRVSPMVPLTLIPTAIAPSPVTGAFDLFELPDADTGFFTSTMPAFPSSAGSGTASVAAAMPVKQVAARIVGALHRTSDGATELALSPEELGHVRLRLEPDAANPDRMVIMISFERPETLDLFRRHAGELAEAIRSAGYSGADIGFEQHGGDHNRDRQHDPHSSGFALRSDPPPPGPSAPRLTAGTSLDLRL